jgi:hypothetical protein
MLPDGFWRKSYELTAVRNILNWWIADRACQQQIC